MKLTYHQGTKTTWTISRFVGDMIIPLFSAPTAKEIDDWLDATEIPLHVQLTVICMTCSFYTDPEKDIKISGIQDANLEFKQTPPDSGELPY